MTAMPDSDLAADPRLYSTRLRALVRGIAEAGEERSFRLLPGALESRRFTFGIPRSGWSYLPLASLRERLDMPGQLQQEFLFQLNRADMLGLVFEEDESGCALSALLEYPLPAGIGDDLDEGESVEPILMGRAYRWLPGRPGEHARHLYQWWPRLDARAMARRIAVLLAAGAPPALRAAALAIIGAALACSDAGDWAYVEVTRGTTAPSAFDLDIAVAELTLGQIRPQLETLAGHFGIAPEELAAALDSTEEKALHRVGAGLDERGKPFLTVHYES